MTQQTIIEEVKIEESIEDELLETRGKPITCKYCNETFRFITKQEKEQWRIDNCICPHCDEKWSILPPTERKLKYLQEQYLTTREEKDFVALLQLMYIYTQSIIKKKFAKALKFEGALIYYTNETITIMVEEYLSKPNFKIELSFGGFLIIKARQAIYNPKQFLDQHTSLDYQFEEGNNLHEMIGDNRKDIIQHIEEAENENALHKKIVGIIEEIKNYIEDPFDDYIRTIAVYTYLKNGEGAFDNLFNAFRYGKDERKGKDISLKTLEILKSELKRELISYPQIDTSVKHIKHKNDMRVDMKKTFSWDGIVCKK
jgi:hypothetical protein